MCAGDHFVRWKPGMHALDPMDLSVRPVGATEEQAVTGHGGADYRPVDTFIDAILKDTSPLLDVYLAAELTAPAILAAESARQGGVLIDVPRFRPQLPSETT